ncbi:hypothetical protein KY330_03680 [Candidatus Woesearchaeota archaeon]|nr:hypothetical protein [Candidatus Woesearchaeota archaeon]
MISDNKNQYLALNRVEISDYVPEHVGPLHIRDAEGNIVPRAVSRIFDEAISRAVQEHGISRNAYSRFSRVVFEDYAAHLGLDEEEKRQCFEHYFRA